MKIVHVHADGGAGQVAILQVFGDPDGQLYGPTRSTFPHEKRGWAVQEGAIDEDTATKIAASVYKGDLHGREGKYTWNVESTVSVPYDEAQK
jgi:hypothetical protein